MNQKQQIDQYCRQYKITGMAAKIDQTVKTFVKLCALVAVFCALLFAIFCAVLFTDHIDFVFM